MQLSIQVATALACTLGRTGRVAGLYSLTTHMITLYYLSVVNLYLRHLYLPTTQQQCQQIRREVHSRP